MLTEFFDFQMTRLDPFYNFSFAFNNTKTVLRCPKIFQLQVSPVELEATTLMSAPMTLAQVLILAETTRAMAQVAHRFMLITTITAVEVGEATVGLLGGLAL